LLAKAVGPEITCWLTHRYREQARSHRGICGVAGISDSPRILWELSLLAKAVGQVITCWLIHRYREQARTHMGICGVAGISDSPRTL